MNYQDQNYDSDELDYSGGLRRKQKLRPSMSNNNKRAYYKISMEYPTQPGYGVNRGPQVQAAKGGYISRSKVRKNESLFFFCFVHPIFFSSFGFWYFGHFSCVVFFLVFFRLAHVALQNVNKDYVIFS